MNDIQIQANNLLYTNWFPKDYDLEFDNVYIPVDPHRIASKLDIQVVACPRYPVHGTFEPDEKRITVNASMDYKSQRFTAAHTLYHAINNPNEELVVTSTSLVNTNLESDDTNAKANIFAVNLLCPLDILGLVIEKEKIVSDKELAKRFWVSLACIRLQKKELGYK